MLFWCTFALCYRYVLGAVETYLNPVPSAGIFRGSGVEADFCCHWKVYYKIGLPVTSFLWWFSTSNFSLLKFFSPLESSNVIACFCYVSKDWYTSPSWVVYQFLFEDIWLLLLIFKHNIVHWLTFYTFDSQFNYVPLLWLTQNLWNYCDHHSMFHSLWWCEND